MTCLSDDNLARTILESVDWNLDVCFMMLNFIMLSVLFSYLTILSYLNLDSNQQFLGTSTYCFHIKL